MQNCLFCECQLQTHKISTQCVKVAKSHPYLCFWRSLHCGSLLEPDRNQKLSMLIRLFSASLIKMYPEIQEIFVYRHTQTGTLSIIILWPRCAWPTLVFLLNRALFHRLLQNEFKWTRWEWCFDEMLTAIKPLWTAWRWEE